MKYRSEVVTFITFGDAGGGGGGGRLIRSSENVFTRRREKP